MSNDEYSPHIHMDLFKNMSSSVIAVDFLLMEFLKRYTPSGCMNLMGDDIH